MRAHQAILCLLLLALGCLAGPARAGSCCRQQRAAVDGPAIAVAEAIVAPAERHGCADGCSGCGCGCLHREPRGPAEPPSAVPVHAEGKRLGSALHGPTAVEPARSLEAEAGAARRRGHGPPGWSPGCSGSLGRSHRILPLRI